MDKLSVSRKFYKNTSNSNPLLSNFFCADPFGIEYNGRLYVYGSNDQQQYEEEGDFGKNTYEKIKSIVCISTDDMVNWTFHGVLDIENIAPWILTSWAPSILSRIEEDGLTHFYMYFSDTGYGVGVLTATDPLGPWISPLDGPIVWTGMQGIEEVPNPFGPAACFDEKGNAYLAFGGGTVENASDFMPGSVRIIQLKKDLISLEKEVSQIPAPYFLEAGSLNFINNTFVYSYCSSWVEKKEWPFECEKSSQCSINYMISKTPMDKDSWKYMGSYFKNPGEQGLNYSNNHSSIVKFRNQYYLLYHSLILQEDMITNGGFRSICVDKLNIDEENLIIKMCAGTRKGVSAIKNYNGFEKSLGNTFYTSADIKYSENLINKDIFAESLTSGAWFAVKNVDFEDGANSIIVDFTGTNEDFIEVRVNKVSGDVVAKINIAESQKEFLFNSGLITGIHDLYFIFSNSHMQLKYWQLKK